MLSPLDTHITFIGGAANEAAVEAVVKLKQAGYDVIDAGHDPRESVLLHEAGIPYVADRIAALDDCQVVLTSLALPEHVEDLYLGEQGLLELVQPGTLVVDLSFTTPQLAREIQAMAAVADIDVVDAPIVNLGEKEESIVFYGGEQRAVEQLSPLLPYLASKAYPQKGPGDGQFAAMLAYVSLAGSLMGAIEAMSLAHIAGFPQESAVNVLASTAGGSRALIDYVPRMMLRDYDGKIKVGQFLDALEVALDAADSLEVTVPLTETAYQLYDLLSIVGGETLNIQAVALLYEDEKTCAEYGLNWALADSYAERNGGPGDYGPDYYGDERGMGPGGPGCPGPRGFGGPPVGGPGADDDDDDVPPYGRFFSNN